MGRGSEYVFQTYKWQRHIEQVFQHQRKQTTMTHHLNSSISVNVTLPNTIPSTRGILSAEVSSWHIISQVFTE